jgi:hypothetical protein
MSVSQFDVRFLSILTKIRNHQQILVKFLIPNLMKIRFNDSRLLQSGRQIGLSKLLVSFPQPCMDSSAQTHVSSHNSHFILRTEVLLGPGNANASTCAFR